MALGAVAAAAGTLAGPLSAARGTDAETVLARARALPADQYAGLLETAEATVHSARDTEFAAPPKSRPPRVGTGTVSRSR